MSLITKDEPSIPLFIVGKKDDKSGEPNHEIKLAQKKHSQVAATGFTSEETLGSSGAYSYGQSKLNDCLEEALLARLAGLLAELEKLFNKIGQKSGKQELKSDQAQHTAVGAYGEAAVNASKDEKNTAMCSAIGGMIGAGIGFFAGAAGLELGRRGNSECKPEEENEFTKQSKGLEDHLDAFDAVPTRRSTGLTNQETQQAVNAQDVEAQIEADLQDPNGFTNSITEHRKEYLRTLPDNKKEVIRKRFERKLEQAKSQLQSFQSKKQRKAQKYNLYSQALNTAGQISGGMGSSIGTAAGAGSIVDKGKDQAAAAQIQQAMEGLNKISEKSGGGRNAAEQQIQKLSELEDQLSRANTLRGG